MEKEPSEAGKKKKKKRQAAVIEHDKQIKERKYESTLGDWKHGEFEQILGYINKIALVD